VHLFLVSGQINVQNPSQYCSSSRAPDPSRDELARLSVFGLGAPPTNIVVKNTRKHFGMTSQTDSGASSSMGYDLNKTAEENEDISRRRGS